MLPRGRPPGPGTAEEKAAIRREKVRLNVKAYRERKKNAQSHTTPTPPSGEPSPTTSSSSSSSQDSRRSSHEQHEAEKDDDASSVQIVVRSKSQPVSRPRQNELSASRPSLEAHELPQVPSSGPENISALLAIFRQAFLPSTVNLPTKPPGSALLVTPCSPWIIKAYNMALQQDSGALKSGLLAVGLILSGLQNGNSDLKVASFNMHRQALCQLRSDLQPITLRQRKRSSTNIIAPYLSCLAVTMFELIQTGFSPTILQHLKALNTLIEMIYNDPIVDRFTADLIMEDFGMLEMMFCLKYEFPSGLRNTKKKPSFRKRDRTSSGDQKRNASVYGDILDIVEDLPALIVQVNAIDENVFAEKEFDDLQQIIRKLIRMQGDLDAWNMYFEVRHSSVMMSEDIVDEVTGKRGIRHRLRSYEHGAVGLHIVNFQQCALDANIDATYKLAQMHRLRQAQPVPSSEDNGLDELNAASPDEIQPSLSDIQTGVEQPSLSLYSERGFLHEQLRQQRAKIRVVVMQLIELMHLFGSMCDSITGQSLLILPSYKAKMILEKEESRLSKDLRSLQPGDHEGAIEVNKYLQVLSKAQEAYNDLARKMQFTDAPTEQNP